MLVDKNGERNACLTSFSGDPAIINSDPIPGEVGYISGDTTPRQLIGGLGCDRFQLGSRGSAGFQ